LNQTAQANLAYLGAQRARLNCTPDWLVGKVANLIDSTGQNLKWRISIKAKA
jgi:hypothetical protein